MREIKFRAWNKEYGEMCYSTNVALYEKREFYPFGIIVGFSHYPTNDWELMQYTGLRDKNGKEVYEGDIVRYTFDNPDSVLSTENGLKIRTGKIFWQEWRASFAIGCQMANNDLFKYVRNGNRVEVIGNIYENPELLQGQPK